MTLITGYFEGHFIVSDVPAASTQWQLEFLRALNNQEETQITESESPAPIAVDIAGTVLNASAR